MECAICPKCGKGVLLAEVRTTDQPIPIVLDAQVATYIDKGLGTVARAVSVYVEHDKVCVL